MWKSPNCFIQAALQSTPPASSDRHSSRRKHYAVAARTHAAHPRTYAAPRKYPTQPHARTHAAHARTHAAHARTHAASRKDPRSLTQGPTQPHARTHAASRKDPRSLTQGPTQPHARTHAASRKDPRSPRNCYRYSANPETPNRPRPGSPHSKKLSPVPADNQHNLSCD